MIDAIEATNTAYELFREVGGWDWMHISMSILANPANKLMDKYELLDSVQRMVNGNDQAYSSLVPHLNSCAALAGAFVDGVEELERNRELATRFIFASLEHTHMFNSAFASIRRKMINLPYSPSDIDIAENSDCKKCRQDWGKKGPICKHCILEGIVQSYQRCAFAYRKQKRKSSIAAFMEDVEDDSGDFFKVEGVVIRLTKLLRRFLQKNLSLMNTCIQQNSEAATLCSAKKKLIFEEDDSHFDVNSMLHASDKCLIYLESLQREILPIKALWRQQLHCYSVIDELQTAKLPMKLLRGNVLNSAIVDQNQDKHGEENLQGEFAHEISHVVDVR